MAVESNLTVGSLYSVSGKITARSPDGSIRSVQNGDPVYLNDVIVAAASSSARINLKAGSTVHVESDQSIHISQFLNDNGLQLVGEPDVADLKDIIVADRQKEESSELDIDDIENLPEPTAGPAPISDGGSSDTVTPLDLSGKQVTPEAGIDTSGPQPLIPPAVEGQQAIPTAGNALPTVTLSNIIASVSENLDTTNSVKFADITINDDGIGTNTFSLSGADAEKFIIVNNGGFFELHIRAGESFDFESQNLLDVTVNVDDASLGGDVDDSVITALAVLDVNEAPSVALSNIVSSLPEDTDTANSIKIADISIIDDALGTNTLTLTGADADKFEIINNNGNFELHLKAGETLDHESQDLLDITVEVDDPTVGGSTDGSDSSSVSITNVNEAPVSDRDAFDDSNLIYEDDLSIAADAAAGVLSNDSDPDGDDLTVSAVNGIDGNVGNVIAGQFGSIVINPDGSYTYTLDNANPAVQALVESQIKTDVFTYTASDGQGGTETLTLTINVVGTDDLPNLIDNNPANNSVFENASNGTAVGITALADDPDNGTSITYSLTDDAGGRFTIDSNTGIVTIADSSLLNHSINPSHDIEVTATSSDGGVDSQILTVNVQSVNVISIDSITDDTGESSSDFITNDQTLSVAGSWTEGSGTLSVSANGTTYVLGTDAALTSTGGT